MKIIFVRHPESTKNVEGKFSSNDNKEPLTAKGLSQVATLKNAFSNIGIASGTPVYTATSTRAVHLAKALSDIFHGEIYKYDQLNSIKSGSVAGMNEQQMNQVAPGYFKQMELYECGVVNAYSIEHPGEPLRGFEQKLETLLNEIIASNAQVVVIVAHKSAITAAIIGFARKIGNYPKDFFGYIAVDTAAVSVVQVQEGDYKIDFVNVDASTFEDRYLEGVDNE